MYCNDDKIPNKIIKPNIPFAMIPNDLCIDNTISALAKSIFIYMFSRPDNWQFYNQDIYNHQKEGRDACDKAIKELARAGWLSYNRVYFKKGGSQNVYQLYNYKNPEANTAREKLDQNAESLKSRELESRELESRDYNNTDYNNTDYNNTDYNNTIKNKKNNNCGASAPQGESIKNQENSLTDAVMQLVKLLGNEDDFDNDFEKNKKDIADAPCGDKSPPTAQIIEKDLKRAPKELKKPKKGNNDSDILEVYESYKIFYYRVTGKKTKLQFLSDTKKACRKIVNAYRDMRPDIGLGEFAYKVFGGSYYRLENLPDHRTKISTASNHVAANIDFVDDKEIPYDFEKAKRMWADES